MYFKKKKKEKKKNHDPLVVSVPPPSSSASSSSSSSSSCSCRLVICHCRASSKIIELGGLSVNHGQIKNLCLLFTFNPNPS